MGILSKIFSGGASGLIDSVSKGIDNLTISKEEKEQFKIDTLKTINEHQEKIASLAQAELDSYLKDTHSAREANVKIQESDKASWLAKNVSYILDIFFPLAFAAVLIMIFKKHVPEENKDVFYMLVGLLGGYVSQVVSFHRGTSKGSQDKGKQLDKILSEK